MTTREEKQAEIAALEAQIAAQFRHSIDPQFVRVYHDERGVVWSKVDAQGRDLTAENSDGVLCNYRSLFVPHGATNPVDDIEALRAERDALRELVIRAQIAGQELPERWHKSAHATLTGADNER